MIRIKKNPTFKATVKVPFEGEETQSFEAEYKLRKVSEVANIDLANPDAVKDFLRETVIGLKEIVFEENVEATFEEQLELAMDYAHIRAALFSTYVGAATGAIRGN